MSKKKHVFINLKKYIILYIILQIFSQVNIFKKCQYRDEALPPYINLLKRLIRLSYMYILKRRLLKNQELFLNNLVSY